MTRYYRNMKLCEVAPDFRISNGNVEIPYTYWHIARKQKLFRDIENLLLESILELINTVGRRSEDIYNKAYGNDPKHVMRGFLIPVEAWNKMMRRTVPHYVNSRDINDGYQHIVKDIPEKSMDVHNT